MLDLLRWMRHHDRVLYRNVALVIDAICVVFVFLLLFSGMAVVLVVFLLNPLRSLLVAAIIVLAIMVRGAKEMKDRP